MTAESDRIGQNDGEATLTDRQVKFLPVLLASPTYTQACEVGQVSRDTLYLWLKQPAFKAELDRQRDELVAQGFALLSQSVTQAIEVLAGLLNDGDKRLRRFAANDILSHFLRHKELEELTRRIEAIEQALEERGR